MQYEIRTVKKVGVGAYESELNSIIQSMTADGWTVQQLLGNADQGIIILFAKE